MARGFSLCRTEGGHKHYEAIINGKRRLVTVDPKYSRFDVKLMQSIVRQSGLSREEFYSATKAAAKMAGLKRSKL